MSRMSAAARGRETAHFTAPRKQKEEEQKGAGGKIKLSRAHL